MTVALPSSATCMCEQCTGPPGHVGRLASRWPAAGHPGLAGCRLMFATRQVRAGRRAARGERFGAVMTAAVRVLPFGLNRVVPPRLLGFAAISSVTFPVDLALLTAARSGLRWPLTASITVAYLLASGLGYLLNRSLNFRSHAAVGPQLARYTVVLVINYFGCILGVTTGLATLGLNYQLARTAASGCEMVYMYAAMRWIVFRDPPLRPGPDRESQ